MLNTSRAGVSAQRLSLLHVDQEKKLPLHTFLPSPAEVLPLLLPMSVAVVTAMTVTLTVAMVTAARLLVGALRP